MDSTPQPIINEGVVVVTAPHKELEATYAPMVDPFLVEALQNPRHRLTILRMELDIQKFLQNSDQQQFEFQHFPTSYLRLAAHRVAQHYGLQTMVQDNVSDGSGTRIVVKKMAESRIPALCLSEIPAKQLENDKHEQIKIVIRPRPNRSALNEAGELGNRRNTVRTVEERKEDYDRARARIFSGYSSPEPEDAVFQATVEGKSSVYLSMDENDGCRDTMVDSEKILVRDGSSSSRVAIFRDREKDLSDPDYDRSYERYVRNSPVAAAAANQSCFGLPPPFNVQKFQPPFVLPYDNNVFAQLNPMPRSQVAAPPLSYRTAPVMGPFCTMGGLHQASRDNTVYSQWPTPTMMYAHSYDQFRHAVFQAPYCPQQALSFEYSQHHH